MEKFMAVIQLGFIILCFAVIAFVLGMMVQDVLTGRASTAPDGYVEFHGTLYICEPAPANLIVVDGELHKVSVLTPDTPPTQTAPAN